MGYSISIGNLIIETDEDEEGYEHYSAELVRHDEAPAYGEPTDFENQRWPSYGSWFDSMKTLGLVDLIFNVRNKGAGFITVDGVDYPPLLESHPGYMEIKKQHLEYLEDKLNKYRLLNLNAVAGFGDNQDGALARGEWLLYWVKWAVENCEKPTLVNT